MRLIATRRGAERAIARARLAAPTYDGPPVAGLAAAPPGYELLRHAAEVGRGDDAFERARDGLFTWASHRVPGVRVLPLDAPAVGTTHLVTMGVGSVALVAPCRIVAVVAEPTQAGFSYRTLPGHPERGEESFLVRRDADLVVMEVVAVSQPASALVRRLGRVGRLAQRLVARAYVRAVTTHVARSAAG